MTQETIDPKVTDLGEDGMIGKERWEEIRRLAEGGETVSAIARHLDLDRKTVRGWLRKEAWTPYQRGAISDAMLGAHGEFLQARAAAVDYSAQILYQELRQQRGYTGSYATVRRFVRPLREAACRADLTWTRFETPPGHQSQVDWGQARVCFGADPVIRHIFVLTLGYSRRSVYVPCLDETLGTFLDAHETAFEHFGGHTQEHLYDRARTVCHPADGGARWNVTFKAFAAYWSFEPRLCRPYRAQTKGKVESGVKYFRRNFLPGRTFRDDLDFGEQLAVWTRDVADVRVHGTTHERPIDRFVTEAPVLLGTAGQPPFRLEATQRRVVAEDYLVSFETNRYSVPFRLIGQEVEVRRHRGQLEFRHRGALVAAHSILLGKYQVCILPEHGPGPIARTQRTVRSTPAPPTPPASADVEVRDLTWYDAVCSGGVQ
ncbi:MAG: IS21 family transposase [Vicinamibacterales bacterium]